MLGKKFEPKLLGEKAKLLSKLTVQSSSISQDINSLSIGHEFEQDHVIFLTNLYELSSLTAIEALIAPEWDLGHSTWLATGISYQHYVFSGIVDASSTAPNFFIQLGQKKGSYNVLLQGRMILMTLDSEQFLQRADESLILDMPINQTLDLNLEGHLTQYSYKINETDGPDWRLKIKTNIFYKFTKNIKFGATGLFEQVGGNRRHNLNGVEVIGFDHENTGAGILLDISPFPWMKLSVIGQFHDRKVSGIEPDDDTSKVGLSESFSTYATSLSGSLTAQYQF